MECLYYKGKRDQCELKVIDCGFTLSLKKSTLSFAKNGVRLDVCHWEDREVIWVGLALVLSLRA